MSADLSAIWAQLGIPADHAATRHLTLHAEAAAADLVVIGLNDERRPIRLVRGAAEAWRRMQAAAQRDGIELIVLSGFRSIARQTEIVRAKLAAGRPIADILRSVAPPGCSEHHTGRALDIGSPERHELDERFAATPAFHWLERCAAEFRFALSYPRGNRHGFVFEPWHWCWQTSGAARQSAVQISRPL